MPELLENLTVFSPAKVNLHLIVQDKRPDDFHNLESVFLAVDFGDTLHFASRKEEGGSRKDECEVEWAEGLEKPLSIKNNIILRAVSLFREKTGFDHGLKIRLEKRIPIGGGLGGGASTAAAALLAMNK